MHFILVLAFSVLVGSLAGSGAAEAAEKAGKAVRFVRGSLSNSPVYGPYNSIPVVMG